MKTLNPWTGAALALFVAASVCASARASVPAITAPTVDLAGVLSASERTAVDQALIALRDATGVQMAVLIVGSLEGRPIEDYAFDVFMKWGGGSAARSDGVLYVLSVGDRRGRLQLGYGIEEAITDAQSLDMLEALKPDLRAEAYGSACLAIVASVRERVAHVKPGDAKVTPRPPSLGERSGVFMLTLLLAWLGGVFYHLSSRDGRMKGGKKIKYKRLVPLLSTQLRNLVVWVGVPAFVFLLLSITNGADWGLSYAAAWCALALTGWLSGRVFVAGPIRAVIYGIIMLAVIVGIAISMSGEPFADAWDVALAAIAMAFVLAFFSWFWVIEPGTGKGSYSSSRRSSAYSSSSYSSSSSRSSSSSSSSSSWSGGGGSTGGGGASSSW